MPDLLPGISAEALGRTLPAVAQVLTHRGHSPLRGYGASFAPNPAQPASSREGFIAVCRQRAETLLGPQVAQNLARQLERFPVVLTANHHCVDFHPLFVQGNLIFALGLAFPGFAQPEPGMVVPVLGFGTISLANQVFPRGLSLARPQGPGPVGQATPDALRIGLFPASQSQSAVSLTPAFTGRQVRECQARVAEMRERGHLGPDEARVLERLLDEAYADPRVLAQERYSQQASLLNHRVWPRLFAPELRSAVPAMVSLEIEDLATQLLVQDLAQDDGLVSRLLLEPGPHRALVTALEGVYGCWRTDQLGLTLDQTCSAEERRCRLSKCGTYLFWGVGAQGRLTRLALEDGPRPLLAGLDDHGGRLEVPYTAQGLAQALERRAILPNLFTTFLVIALTRGVKCYGGFWQADYLPRMQRGVVAALESTGHHRWAAQVAQVPTANFVTGLVAALAHRPDREPCLAGAVDLMAGGGLGPAQLAAMGDLTVGEASLYGLRDIMRSWAEEGGAPHPDGRQAQAQAEALRQVAGKMVAIAMEPQP